MKVPASVVVITLVLLTFVGTALAGEMSGAVPVVNAEKNTMVLKNQTMDVIYDCKEGSLLKNVKVGDRVTVEYNEAGGKSVVTKITPMLNKKPTPGC